MADVTWTSTQDSNNWTLASDDEASPWYDGAAQSALASYPGVPGTEQTHKVQLAHAVVLDGNIENMHRIHIYGATASLTVNNTAARTITFASTGSDPLGTGGSATKPIDDATMFGIFCAQGDVNLTGNAVYPVTLTSADGSPIYIHHRWGDVDFGGTARFNSSFLTLKYCIIDHPGANSAGYYGIDWDVYNTEDVTIENCEFNDTYRVYLNRSGASVSNEITLAALTFDGCRDTDANSGCIYIAHAVSNAAATLSITDVTFLVDNAANGVYLPNQQNLTWARNHYYNTSGSASGRLLHAGDNGTSQTGGSYTDSIVYNATETAVAAITIVNDSDSTLDGLIAENCEYAYSNYLHADNTIQNVWCYTEGVTGGAHGALYHLAVAGSAASKTATVSYCAVLRGDTGVNGCTFAYDPTAAKTPAVVMDHITAVRLSTKSGYGITFGNGDGSGLSGVILKNSISAGHTYGVHDYPTAGTKTIYAEDYNGVGIHHNATYDNTNNYTRSDGETWSPDNFDDGTNLHPNATEYADLNGQDPQFVDTTRRLSTWAALNGATGTEAEKLAWLFGEFAKRHGINGVTPDAAADYDSIEEYLFAGLAPTNSAYNGAADDGGTIGCRDYFDAGGPLALALGLAITG